MLKIEDLENMLFNITMQYNTETSNNRINPSPEGSRKVAVLLSALESLDELKEIYQEEK